MNPPDGYAAQPAKANLPSDSLLGDNLLADSLASLPIPFALIDQQGLLLDFNDDFAIWGPGATRGQHLKHLAPKALFDAIEPRIVQSCSGKQPDEELITLQHPKQQQFFNLHCQPYSLAAQGAEPNKCSGYACLLSLIPLGAHEEAKPFEDYNDYEVLKITFNTIDQGICIFDEDLKLVSWNQRYVDLVCPVRELKYGDDLFELCVESAQQGNIGEGDVEELARNYCEAIRNQTMPKEEDIFSPNGKTVHVRRFYLPNNGIFGLFTDVTDQRKAEQLLIKQANYDSLTKTVNRKYMIDYINGQISRDPLQADSFALLFLDLDRFKQVNDSFGHRIGDMLLTACVQRIRNLLNPDDSNLIARIGGDEFLLCINSPRLLKNLEKFAARLCDKLSAPYSIEKNSLRISVSIGICRYPEDGRKTDNLISKADTAMYRAKMLGRNCFQFYNSEIGRAVRQRNQIANQLTRDLAEKQGFELVYQPIINCLDKTLCGAEALLRWHNDTLGEIAPQEFIPVAEENGIIVELGGWVIQQIADLLSSLDSLPKDFYISVNVSALQILREDFASNLLQQCRDHGINPSRIMVEITESSIIDDIAAVENNLAALREAGFKLAIDDFGTGYSSLSYVIKHNFTHIKIDRMFIGSVPDNQTHNSMIKAIIELARTLSLEVIAEGVETQQQLDAVHEFGGHFVQGFLLGKPQAFDHIQRVLN